MRHALESIRGPLVLAAALSVWACAPSARGDLIHRYSFTTDASDSVGGANGTLMNVATVGSGQLQLNNPNFTTGKTPDTNGYLSLPPSILPTSGSATIESWFTFTGSGFFTEDWTFTNNANDTNPPGQTNGQYLMHTISAPQPMNPPGGANTGGSHIAQALNGYQAGSETDAYGTTPNIGAGGGGYLDDGGTYMAATVIDGTAGTLSYYLFRVSDGVGGLQQAIPANALSSYSFTNAFLGRSPFLADNATSGSIDEFRIYNDAESASQVASAFALGPDVLPEPTVLSLFALGAMGLLARRNKLALSPVRR